MLPTTHSYKDKDKKLSAPFLSKKIQFYIQTSLLSAILLVCLYMNRVKQQGASECSSSSNSAFPALLNSDGEAAHSRPSKKVFFDFGANRGDSLQSFTTKTGERAMGGAGLTGLGANDEWELWGFEANPFFTPKLKELEQKLNAQTLPNGQKQYKVFMKTEAAATTQDGKITFYLDTVNERNSFWGSSLLSNHGDVVKSGKKSVSVDGYSVSDLILKNYNKDDYIVVKMDIEGAEFDVLVDMITSGAMKYVDMLLCEYHGSLSPRPNLENNLRYMIEKMGVKQVNWS